LDFFQGFRSLDNVLGLFCTGMS